MNHHAAAYDRLVGLLESAPHTKGAWRELPAIARAAGRFEEARALCLRACDADPSSFRALGALLHFVPDQPEADDSAPGTPESARQPLSIVVCSNKDARYAEMAASYERALGDWPHEFVRIDDATSLAGGYARGLARATGAVVIFSHDDVELLAADFGPRLARRLAECDLLGIAGATRATGPAWPFAGWPHLHGCVIYPEAGSYRVAVYSRAAPLARGIRVMDGAFLAMKREVALRVGWDADTCDGFHCYDVDFTLRAAQAGLRLAVATDLGVVHHSSGSFDERWEQSARKLIARHPELNAEPAEHTGPVTRTVPSAGHALALVDNWARMGRAG
jgi:hypothetical protein